MYCLLLKRPFEFSVFQLMFRYTTCFKLKLKLKRRHMKNTEKNVTKGKISHRISCIIKEAQESGISIQELQQNCFRI